MGRVLLVALALLLVASCAYAECMACRNLNSDSATNVVGARLCNGVCNTAFGWTEIFFRPGKVVSAGGNPIVGFFRGLGNAVARTGLGAVELVTFWVPGESLVKIDDCPLCAYR